MCCTQIASGDATAEVGAASAAAQASFVDEMMAKQTDEAAEADREARRERRRARREEKLRRTGAGGEWCWRIFVCHGLSALCVERVMRLLLRPAKTSVESRVFVIPCAGVEMSTLNDSRFSDDLNESKSAADRRGQLSEDDAEDSEGEGPLPVVPGAAVGRDRGLKHGGDLAPLSRMGTGGVQINPKRRARGAKVEKEIVKMRTENQR